MATRILVAAVSAFLWASASPAQSTNEADVFGDWERVCQGGSPCSLMQETRRSGSDDIILRSEFTRAPAAGNVVMTVQVPRSVDLRTGPWLTIDGLYITEMTYFDCRDSCRAVTMFDASAVDGVLQGRNGMITVIGLDGSRIGLRLSLAGLSEGLTQSLSE